MSGFLALTLLSSGCSSSPPVTPSNAQVSGVWLGEQTVRKFTGGECLAPVFQELLGFPSQFHATLVQSGNSVTASSDIDHTGAVCTFKGTIVGNSLVLTETGCSETHTTALGCPNGDVRDLVPESESLHATIDGDRITGTAIETDGVIVSGTPDRAGTFVGTSSFEMTRP